MTAIKYSYLLALAIFAIGCQHGTPSKIELGNGPLTVSNLKKNFYPQRVPVGRIVDEGASKWMTKNNYCLYYCNSQGFTVVSTGRILRAKSDLGSVLLGADAFILNYPAPIPDYPKYSIFIINYDLNYNIPIRYEEIKNGSALKRKIEPGDVIYIFAGLS